MNNLKLFLIAFGLIIVETLIGYYFPFFSILFMPIIVIIVLFLSIQTNLKNYLLIILIIIALLSNDAIIKMNNSNTNDFEGAGVINLFFLSKVLILTLIIIILLLYKHKGKLLYILLLCALIPLSSLIYLSYFDFLGLINYKNTSKSKETAVKNKVFLNDLKFSINPIIYKNDTLKIINGWAEKQIIVNHEHLIKRYDDTSLINYKIKLIANKSFDDLDIRYNVNNNDVSGSNPVDSTISFNCPKSTKNIIVYIFKDDTIINKLIINN